MDVPWRAVVRLEQGRAARSPPKRTRPVVTLQTGTPSADVVMGIYRPEGELRWISIQTQPLRWEGTSEPWGVSCTFAESPTGTHGQDEKRNSSSVVSHELRTPLTSISGALGLLAGATWVICR